MSHNHFKPDISTSTGYPGGQQHSSASPSVIDMDINALLLRVDSLEQTLQHLQGKFSQASVTIVHIRLTTPIFAKRTCISRQIAMCPLRQSLQITS